MKWYHILISFIIGLLLGAIGYSFWPSPETNTENPLIHKIKEQELYRQFRENKFVERTTKDSIEKIALAKDVINERQKSDKAIARYNEVKKAIPLTRGDSITFLQIDTAACDSALLRARELAAGLTIEIMTDNSIIKNLDSLNSDLNADKKDLVKVDSLNHIEKKQLRKAARRKARRAFFTGAGIGGAIVAILISVF